MFNDINIKDKLLQNLDMILGQRLMVVGDIMLDHYQWGEVSRISPEAPVPVVYVQKETYSLGGSGNVAANIKSLGGEPFLISVTGDDEHSDKIRLLLEQEEIEHILIKSPKRKTTVKTRVIGNTQQIVRVDKESNNRMDAGFIKDIIYNIKKNIFGEYILISDYGKGMVSKQFLTALSDKKIVLDPKIRNFKVYKNTFLLTPNQKEAEEGSGVVIKSNKDIIRAGKKIIQSRNLENLLITLGPQGMVLFKDSKEILHFPTSAKKVFDVTGAGDTVIAVMGICLQTGQSLQEACMTANYAAGLVVGQVGTAKADRESMKRVINSGNGPEIFQW